MQALGQDAAHEDRGVFTWRRITNHFTSPRCPLAVTAELLEVSEWCSRKASYATARVDGAAGASVSDKKRVRLNGSVARAEVRRHIDSGHGKVIVFVVIYGVWRKSE